MTLPDISKIKAALQTVKDPEIPINLYDLGLIYDIAMKDDGCVRITMTLTTPNCPVAELLPTQIKQAAASVEHVNDVVVDVVFDPPWSPESMSEDGKMQLEMMGLDWQKPIQHGGGMTSLTVGRTPGSANNKKS